MGDKKADVCPKCGHWLRGLGICPGHGPVKPKTT